MPDLPVAAPDHAAVLTLAESLPDGALKRGLVALLAERQQDKERIERLETALFQIATCLDVDVSQVLASRALAVEEDAPNG